MILIDAGNISSGGGLVLLNYLLDELVLSKSKFYLIKHHLFSHHSLNLDIYINYTTLFDRRDIYNLIIKKYSISSVLAFGNYPPPIRLSIPVFTYMHNPYLIESAIKNIRVDKILLFRKLYLKTKLKNTSFVLFQTKRMLDAFCRVYNYPQENCMVLPFYNEDSIIRYLGQEKKSNRFIYPSLPHPHKNHIKLLEAWVLLLKEDVRPELVLTIPLEYIGLIRTINDINKQGALIINLGWVSTSKIYRELACSEFCIFPSLKETLGLSLVEAAILNLKLMVSNSLDVSEIAKPSLTFDPYDSKDIAEAVRKVLSTNIEPAVKIIPNKILELVSLITNT